MKSQKLSGAVAGSGAPSGGGVGALKAAEQRGAVARQQEHCRTGAEDVAGSGRTGRRSALPR